MPKKPKKQQFISKIDPKNFRLRTATMQVSKVLDGETLEGTLLFRQWLFLHIEEPVRIRLAGINAPEIHVNEAKKPNDYAVEAVQYAKKRVEGRRCKVVCAVAKSGDWIREQQSNWGEPRLLAFVHPTLFGFRQESLNVSLVRKGWAKRFSRPDWMTRQYNRRLASAEREAQRKRRGVWRDYQGETGMVIPVWQFWLLLIIAFLAGMIAGVALMS